MFEFHTYSVDQVIAVAPGNETVHDDKTTWTRVEQHVAMNVGG